QEKRDYEKVVKAKYNSNVLVREQILRSTATSIYELLRGSISGVTVTYGDNGQMVSIRGGNSFSLDSEPLFIVDGMQYESSSDVDSSVSIDDIVRLEVVKDGSAYGMKGANGAIIITTLKEP
ncbi:MAG: TonB-dependent receptor plug domain-containing protein, partial [Duncaniella sp.]|nr:TonB-dependent receptor plug domain-containing protein [Duncaniella sp.]